MDWKPLIRQLLYSVQFEQDPLAGTERVLKQIRDDASRIHPGRYLDAIHAALSSTEPSGQLVKMPHSEEIVRRFLESLRDQLEPCPATAPGKI